MLLAMFSSSALLKPRNLPHPTYAVHIYPERPGLRIMVSWYRQEDNYRNKFALVDS
jgi:hypothetical protein